MEKFFNDLATPYWWISVVIIGLLINIFSTLLYTRVAKIVAFISNTHKKDQARTILEIERIGNLIYDIPALIPFYTAKEIRLRTFAMASYAFCIIFVVLFSSSSNWRHEHPQYTLPAMVAVFILLVTCGAFANYYWAMSALIMRALNLAEKKISSNPITHRKLNQT